MKQTIEIEDGVVPEGEAVDRIGWPKEGEWYVGNCGTAIKSGRDYGVDDGMPCVILREVWTAPEWFLAERITRVDGDIRCELKARPNIWYLLEPYIDPKALNLPADWDGSPMRCRPEVGQ